METTEHYIPALRFHWLTPLYDPFIHRFMREDVFRPRLILEADILPGMRVLDLGCGTGTLTVLTKKSHVMAQVYGIDADPKVLAIARAKAEQAGAAVTLERGMAYRLPYNDAWFDRVLTSLVVHHLDRSEKQRAFNEVYRVLRPGGKFVILDFGEPHSGYNWLASQVMRYTEHVDDNVRGLLPSFLMESGFKNVAEVEWFSTIVGGLSLYRAEKPSQV